MVNYYDSDPRNRHTVKTSDPIDRFIYERMEKLKMPKFKRYFIHLLSQDGFKPTIDDI